MTEKNTLSYKSTYRRRLPHIQPSGAILFVTFRLKDSIPQPLIRQWQRDKEQAILNKKRDFLANVLDEEIEKVEKIYFKRFDELLEQSSDVNWLSNPEIAQMIVKALHHRDGKQYELYAFCIMSNHVHIVIRPLEDKHGKQIPLSKIMHSLKRHTASEANKILDRKGQPFWQAESYDRVVRDEIELQNIIGYVLNNPVKAGLVKNAEDWLWSYCKAE